MSIQDDDPIPWEDGRLKISDFKGKPPQEPIQVDEEHVEDAESVILINPIVIRTSTHKTEFKFEEVGINALFLRKKSWIFDVDSMSYKKKAEMLIHEQGHFDMTQMFCLMAREEVEKAINGKTFPIHSTTSLEIEQEKQSIVDNVFYSIVEKCRKRLKIEQDEYEIATLHGLKPEIQAEYTENFNSVLRN